ncbi:hypothetical protein JK636_20280 [Clostridium sp. YIM B02515]|uniref:LysR substrate-binding domain-containing protein n=1 Tax=Clostridium rhizosphaerae TaxID=2803861 RepID=A0ABS1TF90_9CLOT|nr:LysR substrate-binding domain-containing protein [Clostridium rhizosphaerae]MBL4938053.1 hypothetical protein [Clostridium rhizosphaerae]
MGNSAPIEDIFFKPNLMNTIGCPNRIQLEAWLKSKGVSNIRYMEFNNLNSIIEGVVADLGASLVPQSSIEEYEKAGLIKSFEIPSKYNVTKTFFIRRKDSLLTSSLSKFIEMVELNTPYKRI